MKWFLGIFLAALLTGVSASAAATPKTSERKLNPAENWVVAQVTAGKEADLREKFPNELDRKLGAHFLEDLLTGELLGVKPQRTGVRISGATIDEAIDLSNAQIAYEVWLDYCQFMGPVMFLQASFARRATFEETKFKADANFAGMKVGDAIVFTKAVFEGPVDFSEAEVRHSAFFNNATFVGPVDFGSADVGSNFEADGAKFQNKEKAASFNSMKVGGYASFNDAVFEGPVMFVQADITGIFMGGKAKFQNKETGANFTSMKVGSYASFNGAVFEGPVNFGLADIGRVFTANETQFQNKEKEASFSGMKVGRYALFNDTVFEGPVDFGLADIAGTFAAQRAKFQNKKANFSGMRVGDDAVLNSVVLEGEANLNSMKVGGDASFIGAVCDGPVTFSGTAIKGNFNAQGAKFQNKEKEATFNGMKVGGDAYFNDAVFEGPVMFVQADITGSFMVAKAKFKNKETGANFLGMKVGGYALFNDVVFEGPATLSFSNFAVLNLSETVYAGALYLEGTSYKEIRAAPVLEERKSHEALLNLVGKAAYRADVYGNLEEFFKRQGYRTDADRAFIKGKCRERKEYFRSHDWFRWLGSWMLYLLVGYGRHPWLAGIPLAVLVAVGCLLFSPEKMELQKQGDTPRVYNRFWYSLGLFLPVVDLQADKVWKPKADQTFLRNYVRVHALLGWILIPILLAAIAGLIK